MNTSARQLLHYLLIVMMLLMPVRSVFAMQLMACEHMMPAGEQQAEALSLQHCQHESMEQAASQVSKGQVSKGLSLFTTGKSCCDDNSQACSASCHFAMSASLFLAMPDFSPGMLNVRIIDSTRSDILLREFTPPYRPPLSLHS